MKKPQPTYRQSIGPLDSKQFGKMQTLLEPLNELQRMHVLYNLLKLMKEMDDIESVSVEIDSSL